MLGSLSCGCKGLVRGGRRLLVSDVRAWEKESKGLGDAGQRPEHTRTMRVACTLGMVSWLAHCRN